MLTSYYRNIIHARLKDMNENKNKHEKYKVKKRQEREVVYTSSIGRRCGEKIQA